MTGEVYEKNWEEKLQVQGNLFFFLDTIDRIVYNNHENICTCYSDDLDVEGYCVRNKNQVVVVSFDYITIVIDNEVDMLCRI